MGSLRSVKRKIYRKTRIGDVIRFPTSRLRVRIRGGPCRGLIFSLPTRARFLRGDYELPQATFTAQVVREGEVFWDVGAHYGYYTLLSARATAAGIGGGVVHAFEPSPANLWFLRRHVAWNKLRSVHVHAYAIAGEDGEASFYRRGSGSGHLAREPAPHLHPDRPRQPGSGGRPVSVRTVDSLVEAGECQAPTSMKIDVEGAECAVLRGAERTLRDAPALLMVATHSDALRGRCREILTSWGYRVPDLPSRSPLVACGPGREFPEKTIAALRDSYLSSP